MEGERPEGSSNLTDSSLWPIQGGSRRGEMATPEVDPNDVVPNQLVIMCRTFVDDVVVKGPHHPASTSNTLVEIPHNLPCLESPELIPVPAVRLQHTVQSGGCPKSFYHSPSPSPLQSTCIVLVFCYHPYSSLVPAAEEFVCNTWGSCQCLGCHSPEPIASSSGSGSSTGS